MSRVIGILSSRRKHFNKHIHAQIHINSRQKEILIVCVKSLLDYVDCMPYILILEIVEQRFSEKSLESLTIVRETDLDISEILELFLLKNTYQ